LIAVISVLFAAGTDTTATTMRYAFIFLAQHQDVQTRCQEELDSVVGRDRLPSWELDRNR
jgi:cytochrome P450